MERILVNQDIVEIGSGVSQMIDDYNQAHPNEMLAKSPREIEAQIRSGNSIYLTGLDGILCYGSLYPNFENGEEIILGQVVEIGSLIVHPDYRGRFGLGTLGTKMLIDLAHRKWGDDIICLATIKQVITERVFSKSGMNRASFWNYPYLAYLTCTCENSSERCGFESCKYRRKPEEDQKDYPFGLMPCTLVVENEEKALDFETRCRDIHESIGGSSLVPGEISIESMKRAAEFFKHVGQLVS